MNKKTKAKVPFVNLVDFEDLSTSDFIFTVLDKEETNETLLFGLDVDSFASMF